MPDRIEELKAKAEVLIEALPYIQRFNRRIIVVKYGGSAMLDEELKKNVIQDVTLLKLVGFKPIIVHGGGREINKWVEKSALIRSSSTDSGRQTKKPWKLRRWCWEESESPWFPWWRSWGFGLSASAERTEVF